MQGLMDPAMGLMLPGRDFLMDPARGIASSGLPRNGLCALYDPYRQYVTTGAAQTLTDYSGLGNHGTLGATTGASTDDPAFTGTALSFDGGDLVGVPSLGTGNCTRYTVFKTAASPSGEVLALYGRTNFFIAQKLSANTLVCYWRNSEDLGKNMVVASSVEKATWYLLALRFTTTAAVAVSVTGIGSYASLTDTFNASSTAYGTSLGKMSSFFFEGDIALHAAYNRLHSDMEVGRCRAYIKSLMAPRGIAL